MLTVTNLHKKYGAYHSVKGISFTAKENEVVALLGRNGAGKSTTMRMLAGYLAPTSGDIRLCGESICDNPRSAKRLIGYLRALSDRGIVYDDQLVISQQNEFATGYRGFEALMKLSDRPTAVFTTNHDITMGFLTAAREQGMRIPEDIDIFGFDCVEICSMMNPPLPVVHQPEAEIGAMAAGYLIQRLEGYTGDPRVIKLKCKLNL